MIVIAKVIAAMKKKILKDTHSNEAIKIREILCNLSLCYVLCVGY